MTTVMNPYDALYTNLKNRFTVIHEGKECTVADFMLMKAGKSTAQNSTLPVVKTYERTALSTIADFVEEKLTVKNPPVKETTIRHFPIKTSISALLSSVAACALVLSCGIFALSGGITNAISAKAEDSSYVEQLEMDLGETEPEEDNEYKG